MMTVHVQVHLEIPVLCRVPMRKLVPFRDALCLREQATKQARLAL